MPLEQSILNLPGFELEDISGVDPVVLKIRYAVPPSCPHCQGKALRIKDTFYRWVRHESLGARKTILYLRTHKYLCQSCGKYFNDRFPGIMPYKRSTEAFRREIFEKHRDGICQKTLSEQLSIGQATVERCYHNFLQHKLSQMKNNPCPRVLGDALPSTETGMAVAILDKIDTISGCFLAGLIPTGSQDPYGLRRNALGVINIILKNNNDFYLEELVNASLDTYPEKLNPHKGKVLNEIMLFIKGRIEGLLLEKKIRYDVVNALLERNYDNLTITFKKAEELNKLAKETDFNKVITTFSRVINIIPKHEHSSGDFEDANPHLFKTQEEKELHLAVEKRKLDFLKIIENHEYTSAFKILKELMPAIDAFFEKVMVMDKDEAVKNNRITLLKHLNMMFQKIADFSKIVTQ